MLCCSFTRKLFYRSLQRLESTGYRGKSYCGDMGRCLYYRSIYLSSKNECFSGRRSGDDVTQFNWSNPNPKNLPITKKDIQNLLREYGIGVDVNDFDVFARAFIHRSYTYDESQQRLCKLLSNERMEFLGDGILDCVTKYYLYKKFPDESEGFMTDKMDKLTNNETIGKFALEMGMHEYFLLSRNAEQSQTRTNLNKLGCLFEAFIGANFLDFNRVNIRDEVGWFRNVCSTGPGFQMAQIVIETYAPYESAIESGAMNAA